MNPDKRIALDLIHVHGTPHDESLKKPSHAKEAVTLPEGQKDDGLDHEELQHRIVRDQ